MNKILAAIWSFFGIYWYQFEHELIWARYLEEARRDLTNYRDPLIATNDPNIL